MSDLNRAITEVKKAIDEGLDNISFDAGQAKKDYNLEQMLHAMNKVKTRVEHVRLLSEALSSIEEVALFHQG